MADERPGPKPGDTIDHGRLIADGKEITQPGGELVVFIVGHPEMSPIRIRDLKPNPDMENDWLIDHKSP
jgi:hypothetical protein